MRRGKVVNARFTTQQDRSGLGDVFAPGHRGDETWLIYDEEIFILVDRLAAVGDDGLLAGDPVEPNILAYAEDAVRLKRNVLREVSLTHLPAGEPLLEGILVVFGNAVALGDDKVPEETPGGLTSPLFGDADTRRV